MSVHPQLARQKGMAIIGALVVVAAASVAAASIIERQTYLADTLASERDRAQARWLLRGGLDWARIILMLDARNSAVTLRNAIWAQPISGFEVRDPASGRIALFSGLIEDEQGKYNLARLAVNGAVQPAEVAKLENLLAALGGSPQVAGSIALRVAAAQRGPDGVARAPALRTPLDLAGIEGLSPEGLAMLSEYITLLPERMPINVNTASAEVLSATIADLSLGQARELTQTRDRGQWFTSRGDFLNRLESTQKTVDAQLDVRSHWFKVTGEVTLDHAQAGMQALLHRTGDSPPVIHWIED